MDIFPTSVRVREAFLKQDTESTKKKKNKFYYIIMRASDQRYLKEKGKIVYILEKDFHNTDRELVSKIYNIPRISRNN